MDELKRRRRNLLLIGYHAITGILFSALFFTGTFSGGPCNPGPGLIIFLLAGLIIVGLCVKGIYLIIRDRANKYFFIINFLALAVWIIVLFMA
jgi:hypothetical protein